MRSIAKTIIAVASGKGGVGKSTIATGLALALSKNYKVGLLDADIYGPSIPTMFGVQDKTPEVLEQKQFSPITVANIKLLSMGFIAGENKAMVWRGPMIGSAATQMLTQTQWGDLDYLIIDMPPGTGDVPLSIAKAAKIDGAVVVTTPQNIAFKDVSKSLAMLDKLAIPILGVVENMSAYTCPHCNQKSTIFTDNKQIAADTKIIAKIDIEPKLNRLLDEGKADLIAETKSQESFAKLATKVEQQLTATKINFKNIQ